MRQRPGVLSPLTESCPGRHTVHDAVVTGPISPPRSGTPTGTAQEYDLASGRPGRDCRCDGAADLGTDNRWLLLAQLGLAGAPGPLWGGDKRADGPSGPPPPGPWGPVRGLDGGDGHPDLGVVDGRRGLSVATVAAFGTGPGPGHARPAV